MSLKNGKGKVKQACRYGKTCTQGIKCRFGHTKKYWCAIMKKDKIKIKLTVKDKGIQAVQSKMSTKEKKIQTNEQTQDDDDELEPW